MCVCIDKVFDIRSVCMCINEFDIICWSYLILNSILLFV